MAIARLLMAALVLFAARGASATSGSAACAAPEAYVLGNGVEVRLLADHSLAAVAVVSSVHAGARHDPRGHEGLAHFVEHLTFRSSSGFVSVDDLDGRAGAFHRNAHTTLDTTDYFSVVPPEQLELALWIEARRLALGLDAVGEQQALNERKVVVREHVVRHGVGPDLTARDALARAIFAEGHPYRNPSPSVQGLEHLTLGAARWFFGRHYRPERVRVVILGDFQPEPAKALMARLFGTLLPRAGTPEPLPGLGDAGPIEDCRLAGRAPAASPARVVVATPYRRERLLYTWPVPFDEDGAASLGPLSMVGSAIRLAATESGLADRVAVGLDRSELGPGWWLEIEPIPGQPFEKVATLAQSELARLAQRVPDPDALIAARQAAELEDVRTGHGLLDRALDLARRECRPSACLDPASIFAPDRFTRANRFDPRKAIILESRYRQFARPQGEVESVSREGAP